MGAHGNQAQLGSAYASLSKELNTDTLQVVGGYTLGRVIGEGTFGSVHLATHRLSGTKCAVKKIPKSATAHLTRELHHHRRLHHPHIVHLYEIVATEQYVWLVSELCSGGELFDYLVERGRLLEGEARRLFGELCVAVGWLHKQGVVHRDLKLENVLLDGDMRIKLGDLGFAREWQRGRLMETFCGTTGYASPEMLACKKYLGVETDLWSLGVILYTMLCGGLPFDDDDERVMREMIGKGVYEEPEWLTEEGRSLIKSLLQVDPAKRSTIEDILAHPWFKKDIQSPPQTPNPNNLERSHSGEFSRTEKELETLHKSLPVVEEDGALDTLQLPLALHSRTPSRTKRRSVSSQMSLERRHSHHSVHIPDYASHLNREQAALFSTSSEKHLLKGLTALGIDVGQLMYSVSSDACDASAATWWILRVKQAERGETNEAIDLMNRSAVRRRERPAAPREESRAASPTQVDVPTLGPVVTIPQTPPKEVEEIVEFSPNRLKARSPSMSMLQRATSVLTGKRAEEEGRVSPTKLVKPKPKDTEVVDSPSSSKTVTDRVKRESLWTTFRHMFADDRRKRDNPLTLVDNQIRIAPTVVLTRGPAARGPHVNRLPKRGSLDVRPTLPSRRSSSLNSRRSSVTSIEVPLSRRRSRLSHGSQTPTSDREYSDWPRPDSATSQQRRRSSADVHSPSFRQPPASPLHNYQRRPPSGSNSTRVKHYKVVQEPHNLRSNSVASSVRSNNSSRRSSLDRENESDYETRDDNSLRSLRRERHSLAHQMHRTRSPLMHVVKAKPVRDVFQRKDDEWIDEDEYQGGLGQSAKQPARKVRGVAHFPTTKKSKGKEVEPPRRVGVERMGKPPQVIEEEEEEE